MLEIVLPLTLIALAAVLAAVNNRATEARPPPAPHSRADVAIERQRLEHEISWHKVRQAEHCARARRAAASVPYDQQAGSSHPQAHGRHPRGPGRIQSPVTPARAGTQGIGGASLRVTATAATRDGSARDSA